MCSDRFATISAVELILNQRLIRRVCEHCGGAGCSTCLQTGYHGRVPVVELARLNEQMREEIRRIGPSAIKPARDLKNVSQELCRRKITNQKELFRLFGAVEIPESSNT
jgi:type II secretory ATPase GspE/PulE/Tfp pilus assembly ATPase PilB-like protein